MINFILDKNVDQIRYLYKELLDENFVHRKISSFKFERLKVLITSTIRRIHEELPRNQRIEEKYLKDVINSKGREELFLNISKMINILLESIPEPKKKEVDKLVEKIDYFIFKNYSKEISLLDFAEYMGITLQYASNLYKKIKGETFNKSLREYRIEKSIELYTQNKTLKIKEISTMVGYSNTITFIDNFKRVKNMPPKKYFTSIL